MGRTVRDFKAFLEDELGGLQGRVEFQQSSIARQMFWVKLNEIGARNIASQPPETVPDIDATVELSDEEWADLEVEFNTLL